MASLLRKTESCKCSQHGVLEYRALVQKQPRHMPLPRDRSPRSHCAILSCRPAKARAWSGAAGDKHMACSVSP